MATKTLPQPKSRSIATWKLTQQIDDGWVLLDAPYQREIVWDVGKMSELIDSVFHNYYIPPLVFAIRKIKNKNTRIVIDGKQRLTSMRRFMNNEIPYVDHSSGSPVDTYYFKDPSTPENPDAHYLSEEAIERFNAFEFVCVEYSNITEDDEFDIFSRVQLGVAITSAEKLKAHNTPIAKLCRQLAKENSDMEKILPKKGPAYLFQYIAHMMLTLKNDKNDFKALPKHLAEFVSSNYIPTSEVVDSLKRALHTITALAADNTYRTVFTTRRGARQPLKVLELLAFTVFVGSVKRTRTLKNYAEDFKRLRDHLLEKKEGRIYMGKETFNIAMEYVENRLLECDLMAAPRPLVFGVMDSDDDDDSDELKLDEYEPETSPIPLSSSSTSPISSQPAGKRKRSEKNNSTTTTSTSQRQTPSSRPTARRGNKSTNFSNRRTF